MQLWRTIVQHSKKVQFRLHQCRFTEEFVQQFDWDEQIELSNITVSLPVCHDGSVDQKLYWKFGLLTGVNIWRYGDEIASCFGWRGSNSNPEMTESARHLFSCSRVFWSFGFLPSGVQHRQSPHRSMEKTWQVRLVELDAEPGEMETKVLSELRQLGFVWDDKKGEAVLWLPSQWAGLLDVVKKCPSLKTVYVGRLDEEIENVTCITGMKNLESLELSYDWDLSNVPALPGNLPALREMTVSNSWLSGFRSRDYPRLEQLRIFGVPDQNVIGKLNAHGPLKELTVYRVSSQSPILVIQRNLSGAMPGIKVEVREFEERLPDFMDEHRKLMRKRIYQELFDEVRE